MKLKRVRFRNFRSFQSETAIELEDLTTLVGRNDAGKSTILEALALFFGEYTPDGDDASLQGNRADMAVICEFDDLPAKIVIDTEHSVSASDEWILNSKGRLEIHKVFDGSLQKPKLTKTFLVAEHPTAEGYNDLLYLKNRDLKARARELGVSLEEVDQRINSDLRHAIWGFASDLNVAEQQLDIDKEDAKKIWAVLSKQLPLFAIFRSDRESTDQDAEAQTPLKSAVEEALRAQEAALQSVAASVEQQVLEVAKATVEKLREMDPTLAEELNPRFTKPNWGKVFGISLTDDSQIPVNKRGSGVRRLILLNFFRAQAEKRLANAEAPGIIYAIEEPETSQHPNNQRIILSALRDLSEQPGCQVIFTTHTPVLVRELPLQGLRYLARHADGTREVLSGEGTYEEISASLGVIPDHDVRLFIGVEGVNDINFLCAVSAMLKDGGEDVLDLRAREADGTIVFIPVGGSNLTLWANRLAGLNRPEFHLYDRDEQPPKQSSHQSTVDELTARGAVGILTGKREMENYIHPDAIQSALGVAVKFADFDDVPDLVAQQIHVAGGGIGPWDELDEEKKKKKVSRAKQRLNKEAVAAMTPVLLTASDPDNDVRGWLSEIARLYNL